MRAGVEALAIPHRASQVGQVVTISIGVASGRCDMGSDNAFWLTGADRMLYRSKLAGRNRVSGQVMSADHPLRDASALDGPVVGDVRAG